MAATDVKNGRKLKPASHDAAKFDFKAYATETIAQYDILVVTGRQGAWPRVAKADAATAAHARARLYMARSGSAANKFLVASPLALIKDVDTSALAVGDSIFLGTAGQTSTTTTGFGRRIGTVVKAATVVNGGAIEFSGFAGGGSGAGNGVLVGTTSFASGNNAVTVTNPFALGATLTGRPAGACLNTADGTTTIASVVWSTNDLVITRSASPATTPTVAYWVFLS